MQSIYLHMTKNKSIKAFLILAVMVFSSTFAHAQIENRWLSVGSFHNFYSSIGMEIEQGFFTEQQGGWQWPAIYRSQDAQAAKGLWLGATNVLDDQGNNFPFRVVHVGPRENGLGEFFPLEMTSTSKFPIPAVLVDGVLSEGKTIINDNVDPSQIADRQIYTKNNTLLGVTMERTVMQFSQQYNDNYHIIEYVFTNTGNTDGDDDIELPNNTVTDFVVYFQNRLSPVRATRFVIGNATGWGINTMNDRRGDGVVAGEAENFRASFAWHGYFPTFANSNYDNIGGPIFVPNTSRGYIDATDTTGRLGSYHFVGTVVLHADTSPQNTADDPNQPFTMDEVHSDDPINFNNSAFDVAKMGREYNNFMTVGRTGRHALRIEPSGDPGYIDPSADPSEGQTGGYSYSQGYGPYTLAPGESVRIVVAEASAGISREVANEVGAAYKQSDADDNLLIPIDINGTEVSLTKNEWVFTGRDSLFQTFERAIANFNSNFTIPKGPVPPANFEVRSAGGGIELDWDFDGNEADISGFEIYRASGQLDSTYTLVSRVNANERFLKDGEVERDLNPSSFFNNPPVRGRDYYYYITSVGNVNTDNTGLTPTGVELKSNRFYTQTFDPARLLRDPGDTMEQIRVVPNPYNPNADNQFLLDQQGRDRIAFYDIPGFCTIEIYTELGELVNVIEHTNGSGDEFWDLKTQYKQRVASGIYIARIINKDPNDEEFGNTVIRKIVIIL